MTVPRFGTQIRKSPYFSHTTAAGCTTYSIYNHILTPRDFGDADGNYDAITTKVALIDATPQRQVEVAGKDALPFVRHLTPRNLETLSPGKCRYALITSPDGGVISDPVISHIEEDRLWLSAADGDLLLWVLGAALNSGFDISVQEADVAALQVQGPKSMELVETLLGPPASNLRWYENAFVILGGAKMLVTRTGWTSELGFELYPETTNATAVWDRVVACGEPLGLRIGHTSTARRIEGGTLALIADMDIRTSALEVGIKKLVDLDQSIDFIGKSALLAQREAGVKRQVTGILVDGPAFPHPNEYHWDVRDGSECVGVVTSACFSPRLQRNIAIAMLDQSVGGRDLNLHVATEFGIRSASVKALPFYDARKELPRGISTWDKIREALT